VTARLRRRATDVLLVAVGLLLALAVTVDVGRRGALAWRMRVDRHAMRTYLHPRIVDPRLMSIRVHGPRDLVCVTTHDHRRHRAGRRVRARVDDVHPSADAWRIVDASRESVGPASRPAPAPAHGVRPLLRAAHDDSGVAPEDRVRGARLVAPRARSRAAQWQGTSPVSVKVPTDGTNR
jgi:hypothetical protein